MTDPVRTVEEPTRKANMRAVSDDVTAKPVVAKPTAGVRSPIFAELVQAEDDTVGLLAYALYKQNKRDWLASFLKEHDREATQGEVEAYHLGERTPRRVLTYRRLAVDVLAKDPGGRDGEGLALHYPGTGGSSRRGQAGIADAILARGWSAALVAVLAIIGLAAVAIVILSIARPGVLHAITP
ncbi:MAG: hypothetical protein JO357_17965 [Hyphomicrobiales bacterium]|nr:hypothetical protein [Hyphomicrobiales bacterium]MBV8767982.1 hypothetical protein [Hyphomicrobiales bacterium]MBV9051440.1 hypothetical protein [Hyphomicrobiales bacterium]MBV9138941.1 hypothetical protein [Hyphomicrobiales bacterium]